MTDLRAEIANFAVIGEKPSIEFLGPGKSWARNHIPLRLSRKVVDVYQLPVVFDRATKLIGRWEHTTTLFVRNVGPGERKSAERLVTDLCHLLSFATMSEVRPVRFAYGTEWRRWNGEGLVSLWRPPIESDGEAIGAFVHRVWAKYRKLKRTRKLPELIHYLTLVDHPDQPVEVKMLLTFVALENMKGTWARSKRIPERNGQFVRAIVTRGKARQVPLRLEELLRPMFAEAGMRPALTRLVRVRNQIVHFGVTSRAPLANIEYYQRTKALLHEYILRILGYTGTFLDYRTLGTRRIDGAT